jgi:L-ascorbate metabolism protein UlaG (beta-lactamase superfamily)
LLIEVAGKRILTDPGVFSSDFEALTEIDYILITHEHADHFHMNAVRGLLETNPTAIVITNQSVAELFIALRISAISPAPESRGIAAPEGFLSLRAYDSTHAEIYEQYGQVPNTGYLIDNTFFYPGDAYTIPEESVKILALPVAGPWCKVSEALRYAYAVKPQVVVPVHDAVLSEKGIGVVYPFFTKMLAEQNIEFTPLEHGREKLFE